MGLAGTRAMRRRGVAASVCAVLAAAQPVSALADILHLANGGTVEGDILKKTDAFYRVRTVVGTVTLPVDAVDRVEESETPFAAYEQRLANTQDTPQGWFDLAQWCEKQGLAAQRKKHLQRAIELDPAFEPARAALGFVKVGGLWIDGRTADREQQARQSAAGAKPQERDASRIIAAIQAQWSRRIRAIRTNMLHASVARLVENGQARILEISDPLAILPLARHLSDGKYAARDVLVDVLARFPQDEATMNLAVLSITDPEPGIRKRAVSALLDRDDPRVVPQFREALKSDSDTLIRHAAEALGALGDPAAVPDLIKVLHAERRKRVEIPTHRYLGTYVERFSTPTTVTLGSSSRVSHTPALGVGSVPTVVGAFGGSSRRELRNVTVYRTEVLEALKSITGQNFGFEIEAWRAWHREETP